MDFLLVSLGLFEIVFLVMIVVTDPCPKSLPDSEMPVDFPFVGFVCVEMIVATDPR